MHRKATGSYRYTGSDLHFMTGLDSSLRYLAEEVSPTLADEASRFKGK